MDKQKAKNQTIYGQPHKPLFISLPKDQIIDEWERVLEMRRTNHPLISGGRKAKPNFACKSTHTEQRVKHKRQKCIFCGRKLAVRGPVVGTKYKQRKLPKNDDYRNSINH